MQISRGLDALLRRKLPSSLHLVQLQRPLQQSPSLFQRGIANKSVQDVTSNKRQRTGRFSVEFFGGRRPTEANVQLPELPKKTHDGSPYDLHFRRYPGIASALGPEYYLREGQKNPLSYFHVRSKSDGESTESVMVGATNPRACEARSIDNYVKERTRGFAAQIVLEGRGVKAYWEPKAPHFKVRLGVGAKVKDLSRYVTRDPDIQVTINKKGDIVVLHGPNKARVGTLAYRMLKQMQPLLQPYTGKGAHFAFHDIKRKAVRKK